MQPLELKFFFRKIFAQDPFKLICGRTTDIVNVRFSSLRSEKKHWKSCTWCPLPLPKQNVQLLHIHPKVCLVLHIYSFTLSHSFQTHECSFPQNESRQNQNCFSCNGIFCLLVSRMARGCKNMDDIPGRILQLIAKREGICKSILMNGFKRCWKYNYKYKL